MTYRDPYGTCTRKVAYSTRQEAKATIRRNRNKLNLPDKPYHCTYCDQWHIGHKLPKAQERALRRAARNTTHHTEVQ